MASIDFVLDAFTTNKIMDISATLDLGSVPTTIDASATAIFYIDNDTLKNVFRFSSNSWDINDISAQDIHYFTFMENWPDNFNISPVNAQLNKWPGENAISDIPIHEKMLVKHDFVRYLALKLFKTPAGVDLFNNEEDLINSLNILGEETFQQDISGLLWAKNAYTDINDVSEGGDYESNNEDNTKFFIDPSVNRVCTTDEFDSSENITRELFRQILNGAPERFNDISFVAVDVDGSDVHYTAPLPFEQDDFISFKFTINPATGQHLLTQTTEFGARVYRIRLVIKNNANARTWNTTPID
tara:strand:- start:926 stop:1825 length:900 start_codon:yes stop_codon:yes gene_type:complete